MIQRGGGAHCGLDTARTHCVPASLRTAAVPRVHTAIIGSGPCGLGAAWRLEELARLGLPNAADWTLIESAPASGGLACSVVDPAGFTWDMGGHVIFSHYAYFSRLLDALLPPSEWNTLEREAWVWMRDRFIPYPFQQNIHRLPAEDVTKVLQGLLDLVKNKSSFKRPAHFGEWLQQSFGKGLCEVFMEPYNKKVWAFNPEQMNVEWMGERVATVDTARIISNVISQKDELGWGPNSTFRFPMHGGTGAIWKALFEALPKDKFQFSKSVTGVDVAAKLLSFADGSQLQYEHLISTMPLDCLLRISRGLPGYTSEDLSAKASQFRYSSSHIVGFGLEGSPPPELATKCWLYFPEDNSPFYRATVFSNYSPNVVPKPGQQWSIMTEVSESAQKPVNIGTLIEEVERGLLACKLITPDTKIASRFHKRLEYGYPTPFLGRDQLLAPLQEALEKQCILSRGRFGSWKYEVSNQDHSLMLGVEAADRAMLNTEEPTQKFPSLVNANRDNVGRTPITKGSPLEKKQ